MKKEEILKIIEEYKIDLASEKTNAEDILSLLIENAKQFKSFEEFKEQFDITLMKKEEAYYEIKNSNESLENEDIKIYDRFGLLDKLNVIGVGSDRKVYKFKDIAIKVATNTRGIHQNQIEYRLFAEDYSLKEMGFTPKTYELGNDYVVMESAKSYSKLETIKKKEINLHLKPLKDKYQTDWDKKSQQLQDSLHKMGYSDIMNYNLLFMDFKSSKNWGLTEEGRIVLLYGGTFSKNLLDKKQEEIYRDKNMKIRNLGKKIEPFIYTISKEFVNR